MSNWMIPHLTASVETSRRVTLMKWTRNTMPIQIVKNADRRSHFICRRNKSRTLKMYSKHQKSENHFKIKISTNFAQNPSLTETWRKTEKKKEITKKAWWPRSFHKFWTTPVAQITQNRRKIIMWKSQRAAGSTLSHPKITHWRICHHLALSKYRMTSNSSSISKTSAAQEIISKRRCNTTHSHKRTIRKMWIR